MILKRWTSLVRLAAEYQVSEFDLNPDFVATSFKIQHPGNLPNMPETRLDPSKSAAKTPYSVQALAHHLSTTWIAAGGTQHAEDFENLTRLHYMLDSVHHSGGVVCEPVDLPVPERHLFMAKTHLKLSDKPFMGAVTAREWAADTVEMVRIVFGEKFVNENCCLYSVVNTNAPLVLDATMLDALKVYAKANQAVVVSPFVLGGAMSPVSVAATLAQVLAEVLAGLCLIQLITARCTCGIWNFLQPNFPAIRRNNLWYTRRHAISDVRAFACRSPRCTLALSWCTHCVQSPRCTSRIRKCNSIDWLLHGWHTLYHSCHRLLGEPVDCRLRKSHYGRGRAAQCWQHLQTKLTCRSKLRPGMRLKKSNQDIIFWKQVTRNEISRPLSFSHLSQTTNHLSNGRRRDQAGSTSAPIKHGKRCSMNINHHPLNQISRRRFDEFVLRRLKEIRTQ